MRYLIVCGGKIDKEFGLNEIKTDGIDAIIAADSGMDFLYENGVTPDIIVGDFDSATTKALEFFERKGQTEIHRLNPIKDDKTCHKRGCTKHSGAWSNRKQNRPCARQYFTFGNRIGKWN